MYIVKRKDGTGPERACSAEELMGVCAELSGDGAHALDIQRTADEAPMVSGGDAEGTAPTDATVVGMVELPSSDLVEEEPEPAPVVVGSAGVKPVSEFGKGNQVVDAEAKSRIEGLHSALKASGVNVDAGRQLYSTGTRMASVGYGTQAARKAEHDGKMLVRDAADALISQVREEKREDQVVSAAEMGRAIEVNGRITAFGLALSEQAIRGLCLRLDSPALRYVLGLRDRIALAKNRAEPDHEAIQRDKRALAAVLRHECQAAGDVSVKIRTRRGPGDVFAVVSPSYSPADAPEALAPIVDGLPKDARGSFSYDASSTAWELRANVWTPTPVHEQAVGEPFEAYSSFASRDNGTSRFRGGGGIMLLACLNAGTYTAEASSVARRHVGQVLSEVERMIAGATSAIATMCDAWGLARGETVQAPSGVPIEVAIPGFYRALLSDRRSELAAVLPGRTETHVAALASVYWGERRDSSSVTRADLANGWTKYIQGQRADVRRDAESAIGSWLVSRPRIGCDVRGEALAA